MTKSFGQITAVKKADVVFEEGSFTTLLGPSGCGKTTILRMIAGLEAPSAGDILIGGRRINDLPIHKRNLGLVFQNYALFPHKTIGQNIAFGLKYRGVPKAEARDKVRQALEIVRLPGVEDRYPTQLSGGQQQRIALARAIVIEPDVLLLDEPLSALDANLREEMRVELKSIQHRIGVTSIFVTHDQSEALAMSDRIVVMSAGEVQQEGAPEEVYNTPATEFVARFLGAANLFDARVTAADDRLVELETAAFGRLTLPRDRAARLGDAGPARLVVRAEKLALSEAAAPPGTVSAAATVAAVDYQGQLARYFLQIGDSQAQAIQMIDGRPYPEGAEVTVSLRPEDCTALPPASPDGESGPTGR
ncbi:ABC transporter ATP-binding protein [Tistlia consotensis]|uniref:ABC transporter ATP-binding protein n=1 Tax=Tistlia consotensis TaxID=1321365 RepID=UPI001F364C24|nr:ABC transporter ATP-binding protein [Tistlia consotensis]